MRTLGALALVLLMACGPSGRQSARGVLVAVDGDLTSVASFTLLSGGDRLTFVPAPDGDYAFPLPHLREHLRTSEPVLVVYEERDGVLVAVEVDDG